MKATVSIDHSGIIVESDIPGYTCRFSFWNGSLDGLERLFGLGREEIRAWYKQYGLHPCCDKVSFALNVSADNLLAKDFLFPRGTVYSPLTTDKKTLVWDYKTIAVFTGDKCPELGALLKDIGVWKFRDIETIRIQ